MFQTFGIEYSFEIDKKFLESKYKELIKLSHPDIDKNVNMEIPIHIIRNYKLLHDPFERALLVISKKTNTSREYLMDKIDSLTMDLKVMDDIFDTDMNIKEIEAGEMRKRDLTSIVERNDKKISEYIKLLETEFKRNDLEVTNILRILKNLKIYQKLNLKLSDV
ncbi:chaperone - related [Cryptosporidium xiaoi]|uniref:Chaperone - related n=1 Tax=Cryptosporidium xiaoi TaxID=659607 RepID=A0AAV9XXE0_9CRYT